MVASNARIPTALGERYAKQLCAHANHMGARADWSPPQGIVEFSQGGTCRISTSVDELVLTIEADTSAQLEQIKRILTADFERFGHRQQTTVSWSD